MTNLGDGTNNIMTKANFVKVFNENVWGRLYSMIGSKLYHAGSGVKLADVYNGTRINTDGQPRFGNTAQTGSNVTSNKAATALFDKPNAIPASYLQVVNTGDRKFFTLHEEDFTTEDNIIHATLLYDACMQVVSALTSIRPFISRWSHSATYQKLNSKGYNTSISADKTWKLEDNNSNFNQGNVSYAIFKPSNKVPYFNQGSAASPLNASGNLGGAFGNGTKAQYWHITPGNDPSSLMFPSSAAINQNTVVLSSNTAIYYEINETNTLGNEVFLDIRTEKNRNGSTVQQTYFYKIPDLVGRDKESQRGIIRDLHPELTTDEMVDAKLESDYIYTGLVKYRETTVEKANVIPGQVNIKNYANNLIDHFWEAWKSRCYNRNQFTYDYYTCHLNCHSSCHSNCHGSRSRR